MNLKFLQEKRKVSSQNIPKYGLTTLSSLREISDYIDIMEYKKLSDFNNEKMFSLNFTHNKEPIIQRFIIDYEKKLVRKKFQLIRK